MQGRIVPSLALLALLALGPVACQRTAQSQTSSGSQQSPRQTQPPPGTAPVAQAANDASPGTMPPGQTPPTTAPAQVILRPAGHPPVTVRVEVARDNQSRGRGLMYRRELDELAGMVFVFPAPEHLTFWMHNTYLPLDMIFITADRRVLGVARNATPMTDDTRDVPGDSQYVLEVRAGFADRYHIADGTPVEFVNVPSTSE